MRIVGVTGGIGSGKSTVSRILSNLNAAVIDYDSVARSVAAKGGRALEEMIHYFGSEIVDDNSELNRKLLADIVFNDPVKLHALNCITHRYVVQRVTENISSIIENGKNEMIVLDTPIPVEKGFLDLADEVWVVTADRETRINRIMQRNNFTKEEALSRINSQKGEEDYLKIADVVIDNNGSVEALEMNVVRLFLQKKEKSNENRKSK